MRLGEQSINRLPDNFQRNGFSFRKIRRNGLVCLYEGTYGEGVIYYLVFTVQEKPPKVFKNKHVPAYERMPGSEYFGRSAWIIKNLDAATIKFDYLVARKQKALMEQGIVKWKQGKWLEHFALLKIWMDGQN